MRCYAAHHPPDPTFVRERMRARACTCSFYSRAFMGGYGQVEHGGGHSRTHSYASWAACMTLSLVRPPPGMYLFAASCAPPPPRMLTTTADAVCAGGMRGWCAVHPRVPHHHSACSPPRRIAVCVGGMRVWRIFLLVSYLAPCMPTATADCCVCLGA